ncbi:MAG: response regulator [Paracoccaceae bacterium]
MNVLIVENDHGLGAVWADHIGRLGAEAELVDTQVQAVAALREDRFDVVILNLNLMSGSAMAVADYASYRWPETKVIFVTGKSFFSDGSIFRFVANACALVPRATPPSDLAALVDYHGR